MREEEDDIFPGGEEKAYCEVVFKERILKVY